MTSARGSPSATSARGDRLDFLVALARRELRHGGSIEREARKLAFPSASSKEKDGKKFAHETRAGMPALQGYREPREPSSRPRRPVHGTS